MKLKTKLKMLSLYASLLAVQFALPSASQAVEQGSLNQCRSIKDEIDYYTALKKQGGSTSQVNKWHKMRNKYKEKYAQYNCKIYLGKF